MNGEQENGTPSSPAPAPLPAASRPADENLPDCWNRVGVYGNQHCAELPQFIHCRNCPVYSTAGLRLLQREAPENYRQWWTSHFARAMKPAAPADKSLVLFKLCSEWLALSTHAVQEIAERRRIHSLPHRNEGIVLGLANIRGELIICVSLGHLLGMERLPSRETLRTQHRRLLVASWFGNRLAFPVDEVSGTERFRAPDLKPPPSTIGASGPGFTEGILIWRERTVGLLDTDVLFSTIDRNLT